MLEFIKKPFYRNLLVLAIVLRLLVAAFYFHPDIKTFNFQSSFLKKGVFNIYSHLVSNKETLPLKEGFVYFPLTYFFLGSYQILASPVLGEGFDSWLFDASQKLFVNENIYRYLLVLKFPFLVLDLAIAFLLMSFFKEEEKKRLAFTFWLFNPFTIILIYIFSNIDIIPVTLTVAALLFAKKEKFTLSSVFLGIASLFKLYPILFIPFLFLRASRREKIAVILIPLLILLATILPFWSKAFVSSALISGLTTRIFSSGFNIGFNETIIVGLVFLSFLFFFAWLVDKNIKLLSYFTVALLVIFSFSHFHIQWLLWPAPFLLILAVSQKNLRLPVFLLSVLALAIPFFYQDRSMTVSLFKAYSLWYDLVPTPFIVLQKIYDPYNFQSILHSLFGGGSMLLSYVIFKNKNS